jgi:hypothetical protein
VEGEEGRLKKREWVRNENNEGDVDRGGGREL